MARPVTSPADPDSAGNSAHGQVQHIVLVLLHSGRVDIYERNIRTCSLASIGRSLSLNAVYSPAVTDSGEIPSDSDSAYNSAQGSLTFNC